ncbi:MAG: UDP-glucose--hexose-1-phosphate uridylyltransferase [Anaerolineae bacterium]|nr:UDP-glucose--hexose-1-phosphate uridylyltransferase [Anaerolineae bacterium]
MMQFDATEHPHRRFNPLTGEHVLVSPHRAKRPWQGQREKAVDETRPRYDPLCYLCAGNQRTSGEINPQYAYTYVFTNDFPALLPDTPPVDQAVSSLLQIEPVRGTCRVLCFSPRHDLSLPQMTTHEIRHVVDAWAQESAELGKTFRWVQLFENKGATMGCSMPHPHGQIWALDALPNEAFKEDNRQRDYLKQNGCPLLLDYLAVEVAARERIIVENASWVAVVPFWAIWPFELLLLPRRHVLRVNDLADSERDDLADILKRMLTRYDNLFETSFPYSMGWHGAPFDDGENSHWQLHAHFYPPLLRSATVRKFMVGFEMLGEAQRDLSAEQAAQRLRDLSEVHYTERL